MTSTSSGFDNCRRAPLRLVVALAFGLASQATVAQVDDVLQAPLRERTAYLWKLMRSLHDDTTRVYQSCDSIMAAAASTHDDLLYSYAKLLKTNTQKHYLFNTEPQRIAFLKSKQAYFLQSPHPIIRAAFYYLLSNELMTNFDFREAFEISFRAKQIIERIGYGNVPEVTLFLDQFFFISYYFEDYRAAIGYSKLMEKYNKYGVPGTAYIVSNRGEAYTRLGDYPNARKLFRMAMDLAKEPDQRASFGISSGNYGNILRLQGHYKAALPYLYQEVAINAKVVPRHSGITCLKIAYCLIQLDSMAKARTYIDLADRLVYRNGILPSWHWSVYGAQQYTGLYYEVKSLYHQKTGSFGLALRYKDSLMVFKDSLNKVFDSKLLMKAHAQQAAEKYFRDLETIEQEKSNALQRRNIVLTAIILITLLLLYLLNYRRLREKQIRALEKKRADDLLAYATEQLDQYVRNIKSKNALIEKMRAEIKLKQVQLPEPTSVFQQQVILTEQGWEQFRELFERVYPDFFDHLANMPADFSPAEIRLLALLKLDIPSKEAAFMLGISIESLRKARYRLRKKIEHLPIEVDFKDLITQL